MVVRDIEQDAAILNFRSKFNGQLLTKFNYF